MKLEVTDDFMDCEMGMEFQDNLGAMFDCTGKKFQNLGDGEEKPNCVHGISESAFGELLSLMKDAFPNAHLPLSFNAAKSVIRDLGLDYQKIHACPNSCMLYWAENKVKDFCDTCGVSRWIIQEKKGIPDNNDPPKLIYKVPANIMRYFPLRPRLQRLFMCKEISEIMRWHAVGRKEDGKLRHPADAKAWKSMDARYPDFSSEIRNVRLGVIADGFNPFQSMNLSHSTWPIVLVNYNLQPWLCMKQENLIHSTLISGPESPKNNNDVYMQPLIAKLKSLWNIGVEVYDALTDENFQLRASVLWIISDFSGYAMLLGWSMKGKQACPFLDPTHKWRLDKRRFNGEVEMGTNPQILSGTDIDELFSGFEDQFGVKSNKKGKSDSPFKKKLIFFDLPYWCHNPLRHNLDHMHIEKNICDKILDTLLNIGGKTKDHAFFDIMVHFPVHLCGEVEYGGPVHLRCMFPIERYLGKLKSYVRNRSKPEGSIAEGYLAEECMTFCSRMDKRLNIRLHYAGQFQRKSYVGGKSLFVPNVDYDEFSFSVLMESVKDNLHYSEIGGVYIKEGNRGGWKMLLDDKDTDEYVLGYNDGEEIEFFIDTIIDVEIEPLRQMQSHVIIRPRKNIIHDSAKKPVKRKYITTQQLQKQQKILKQRKEISPEPNPIMHRQDVTVQEKGAARRKLNLDS
ncbi:uncharacterized protein LOC141685284 [Apium graveolens]|uniref:uncharacterized protein LOC141685284 n=1 Tax=Apium graveolens TaxID=4045 RepID=UPI003D7B03AC